MTTPHQRRARVRRLEADGEDGAAAIGHLLTPRGRELLIERGLSDLDLAEVEELESELAALELRLRGGRA